MCVYVCARGEGDVLSFQCLPDHCRECGQHELHVGGVSVCCTDNRASPGVCCVLCLLGVGVGVFNYTARLNARAPVDGPCRGLRNFVPSWLCMMHSLESNPLCGKCLDGFYEWSSRCIRTYLHFVYACFVGPPLGTLRRDVSAEEN